MEAISRLPPPGGTASGIFLSVLITSYHLSLHFSHDFHRLLLPYHRVDIDDDYEELPGGSTSGFHDFPLCHLKHVFRKSHSGVQALRIKRGCIGITFFVNLMTCVCAGMDNLCWMAEAKEEVQHGSKENGYYEIEFLHFLSYLNYRINPKHYNFINSVPFSTKMSSPKESGQWYENADLDKPKISQISLLRRELLKTGIISNSDYAQLQTPRESLKHKKIQERHQDISDSSIGFKASHSLKHSRLRRYVSSEKKNFAKLKVSFKLQNPAAEGDGDKFQRHLISQLAKAMRIPVPSIQDLKISQGTEVSFTLSAFNDENNVMDDVSVAEADDFLKAKIKSQQLELKDLNGQLLMTAGNAYSTSLDESVDYSLSILVILCITLLMLTLLVMALVYLARRTSSVPKSANTRNEAYRNLNFGRDSSQSVGKYSYDSGLWLGPGPEPNFTVPDAPFYRPPTVEQISSTPRPQTAVRTRLKTNWNVDERALSTIPDDSRGK